MQVTIDGRRVRQNVGEGAVLGPYSLSPGKHSVGFFDSSTDVSTAGSFTLRNGSHNDLVLHRPAALSGEPVVNVCRTPRQPIGPGKARLFIAHTATVAPADVRMEGRVIFTNIASGEFAEADVPAGGHKLELLPTGLTKSPLLGPVHVSLPPRTVTMVHAVGTPSNAMDVTAHTSGVVGDGTVAPGSSLDQSVSQPANQSAPSRHPTKRSRAGHCCQHGCGFLSAPRLCWSAAGYVPTASCLRRVHDAIPSLTKNRGGYQNLARHRCPRRGSGPNGSPMRRPASMLRACRGDVR